MWDSVNIMALVAASASLDDPDQVSNGQRLNTEAKMFVISELARAGYKTIPSQANFIMVDCRRPVVATYQSDERTKRPRRTLVPCPAKSHARHHWEKTRDGNFCVSIQASGSVAP